MKGKYRRLPAGVRYRASVISGHRPFRRGGYAFTFRDGHVSLRTEGWGRPVNTRQTHYFDHGRSICTPHVVLSGVYTPLKAEPAAGTPAVCGDCRRNLQAFLDHQNFQRQQQARDQQDWAERDRRQAETALKGQRRQEHLQKKEAARAVKAPARPPARKSARTPVLTSARTPTGRLSKRAERQHLQKQHLERKQEQTRRLALPPVPRVSLSSLNEDEQRRYISRSAALSLYRLSLWSLRELHVREAFCDPLTNTYYYPQMALLEALSRQGRGSWRS